MQLAPPNNHALGFKADLRAFSLAAAILHDLAFRVFRLSQR